MSAMRKKAFTLIELLVVISIISLLMGILMPTLAKARQLTRNVMCLSNMRQFYLASQMYAENNDDYYPMAFVKRFGGPAIEKYEWDFIVIIEGNVTEIRPGILWQGESIDEIHQCPSFKGENWETDPFSGYNYNRSYIGGNATFVDGSLIKKTVKKSAKRTSVQRPKDCAIFGDGQLINSNKVNKYMLAPFPGKLDKYFSARKEGTQGYRHLKKTNVAYCDGSVRAVAKLYSETSETGAKDLIEAHNEADSENMVGFISEDNSAYDLR